MTSLLKRALIAASVFGASAIPAFAAPAADIYAKSGKWTVESWSDGPDAQMCSAKIANPKAQPEFGSFLRLEYTGKAWRLVSDFLISEKTTEAYLLIDDAQFPVTFSLQRDVIRAPIDDAVLDALVAGKTLNLNLDPSGQTFSLSGAKPALDLVKECVRGHGLENAGNAGTNEYNGYDIAGTPNTKESRYGAVRGWNVLSGAVAGNFAYCTGEFDDNGSIWRLGWDGAQWQVALPVKNAKDWEGTIEVDGDSRSISGSAGNGWTFLWLGMAELDKLRNGNEMIVDLGRASIDHKLIGTAGVITKIEECFQRKGKGGSGGVAAAPTPKPTDDSEGADNAGNEKSCPDDGDRLPITGICAGRAIAYLTGASVEEYLLPDPTCDWVVNEVQIVEDALLYKALRCKGVTAELEFAGGAHWAQLMISKSALDAAYGQTVSPKQPVAWFNFIDPNNIEQELDKRSREGNEAELKGRVCAITKADPATSPDGYIFNITTDDPKYQESTEGPTGPQCGPFSEGDGVTRFWRVLGDYAFLFDIPAEAYQDFDPNSVTLLKKDANGDWAAVQ